jgi:tRNA-dependent cyclodipeptide synthase
MIVRQLTGLAEEAIRNPHKYNGFMGISLRNDFFSKKNMREYIQWGSEMFKEFAILIMDYPDNYSLQIFKDLDEKKAMDKARELSKEKKIAFERVIESLQVENVKLLQFKDFYDESQYNKILALVEKMSRSDTFFCDSLQFMFTSAIGNKLEELFSIKNIAEGAMRSNIRNLLMHYVFEEFSSLVYLTEKGYSIEIDPYEEFYTKKLLYERRFPDLFNILQVRERGHVFLHPEHSPYQKKLTKTTSCATESVPK